MGHAPSCAAHRASPQRAGHIIRRTTVSLNGPPLAAALAHGLIDVVEVEIRRRIFVEPQQPCTTNPIRRVAASGGYIQTPWMEMELRMSQG